MTCSRGKRAVLPSGLEVLGELQALRLIVRTNTLAVQLFRPCKHPLVDQAADNLPMLENEGHFTRAYLQHSARALAACAGVAKAGVEEAGIVDAKFADQWIERHHFGGVVRRHLNRFF